MPLSENEKSGARDIIANALALNEPETMIAWLALLCERKAGDPLIGDNERARWRNTADALQSVTEELEHANAPRQAKQGASTERFGQDSDC